MLSASRLGTLWHIILPITAPGLVTTAILVFISSWNEFMLALNFTSSLEMRTIPVGIALYPGEHSFPWGTISAAIVIAVIPILLVILFFQQRIIQGLTQGAVKA